MVRRVSARAKKRASLLEQIKESEAYREASQFARTFTPCPRRDYAWTCKHAEAEYTAFHEALDRLDAKAEKLMGYLGGYCGLAAAAFALGAAAVHWSVAAAAAPTVVLALLSLRKAWAALEPGPAPFPPGFRDAVRYVDAYGGGAEVRFAAQWERAAVAAQVAADRKADLIAEAGRLLVWAVSLTTAPLLAGLLTAALGARGAVVGN